MKKLIMFSMIIAIAVPFFTGIANAQNAPVCITICPAGAGPDDEITLTAYDEEGEFVDLSEFVGVEMNFAGSGEDGFWIEPDDMVDGTLVIVLGEGRYDHNQWDFFTFIEGGLEVWLPIAMPDFAEGALFDYIPDAVDAGGTCEDLAGCGGDDPIAIDPNVMIVYEEGETEGDFDVSLRNQLEPETSVTVTVDPNEAAEDITLIGGDPCEGGTITFIFDANNWDVPQKVVFKAIDDEIAEPPELLEQQRILLTSVYSEPLQDPNWAGEKIVKVNVMDNDQADILLELVGTGPIRETPVTLLEQRTCTYWYLGVCYNWVTFPQTIGVTLQVKPENDKNPGSQGYVRVTVENIGDSGNPPIMDPCLLPEHAHTPGDPNAIVFTSDGNPVPGVIGAVTKWDVPFNIVVLGNDDEELQAEGAEAEGGQNYLDYIEFFVTDATDARYGEMVQVLDDEGDPVVPPEWDWDGLGRTIDISIEDNECGAYGISYLDVSNPYYLMDEETLGGDPNDWVYDDGNPRPDCYVDIYDILEFATKWLDCSDPQTEGCESYL